MPDPRDPLGDVVDLDEKYASRMRIGKAQEPGWSRPRHISHWQRGVAKNPLHPGVGDAVLDLRRLPGLGMI